MRKFSQALIVALVIALAVPTVALAADDLADAKAAAKAACDAKRSLQATQVAFLEDNASKIERDVASHDAPAKLVTRYTMALQTALHEDGLSFAASPRWTNPDTGREYWYQGNLWIEHSGSDPCYLPDSYAYGFNLQCKRQYGGTIVSNLCNWNVYVALEKKAFAGNWAASWGYAHYSDQGQISCADSGGHHLVDDNTWLRTWVRAQVRFLSDAGAPLHLSQSRKATSYEIYGGVHPHAYSSNPCIGVWCDSPTAPSASGNDPC